MKFNQRIQEPVLSYRFTLISYCLPEFSCANKIADKYYINILFNSYQNLNPTIF